MSSVIVSSVAVEGIGGPGMASPPPGCCEALIHGGFDAVLFVAISHNVLGRVTPIARNRLSCVFKIYFDSLSDDSAG